MGPDRPGSSLHGQPIDEYREVSRNMRLYAAMRLGQLTLFFAVTLTLVVAELLLTSTSAALVRVVLACAGVFFSGAFWVMEERATDHWLSYRKRAVALEQLLAFRQYSERPKASALNVTNAFRAIHVAVVVLWIALLVVAVR